MWLILLSACRSPEVVAFLDDRAVAICGRHVTCGTLADAGYADEAACLDAVDATTGALADDGALACEAFSDADAGACLAALTDTPCDVAPDLTVCDAVCP
jgi:hypothetical protein